jgi:hypothetical protein
MLRIEGDASVRVQAALLAMSRPDLAGKGQQRALHRVAFHDPGRLVLAQRGVVAQRRRAAQLREHGCSAR